LLPRLNTDLPLGVPGFRPFIGARANTAEARLSGSGAPKGEGENVTKEPNRTNNDPEALGGGPGLKRTEKEETENEVIPLNAWALEPGAKETRVIRTDIVRISTTQDKESKLFDLAKVTRELIVKEFHRRTEFYEKTGKVDTSIMPSYINPEYASYKQILGAMNFDEVLRFISEQYRSFKELKKRAREWPVWMKPNPPKNFKPLIIIIRYDNYKIDSEQRTIKLGYYGITLSYKGNLRWWQQREKQGRLMLIFNEAKKRWYAYISCYVVLKREKMDGHKCGIDLGQKYLVTTVTTIKNSDVLMYKGSKLIWDYLYFKERISRNDKLFDLGEIDRDYWLEKRKKYYYKRRKHVDEAFKNLARHLIRTLKQLGIVEIYVGYPHNIVKDKPTESNVSFWSYWKLMERIAITAENYGIAVYALDESGTSKYCAYHGSEVKRNPRGLVWCPHDHVLHSDINAALNILRLGGGQIPTSFNTKTYIVTPRGIRPVKAEEGAGGY